MDGERMRKIQEQEALRNIITQWNANRLDLFSLSEPNEDLEFHGVMRFYFQDEGQKVATKCIRVSSTATTNAVIQTLIEKFRPDMRMLTIPEYALYEIHENGEERRLGGEEKPLLVQLNWHKDDREGRFLLRRLDIQSPHFSALHGTTQKTQQVNSSVSEETGSFKRKLSKREKKQLKKQEKLRRMKSGAENDTNVAEKLYSELPETSFTRSISNPEAVMRRRRQQKLEKKLQQFRSRDGGPDTGGTLKIYGDALCQDVPYKTLLLSVRDTAAYVVREMLDKYSLDKEDPANYCLVQIVTDPSDPSGRAGGTKEYILDEDECPLAILMTHQSERGSVTFHVKRRPADYQPRRRKKKTKPGYEDGVYRSDEEFLPYFLELHPDGSEIRQGIPQRYRLQLNVTEVGSERSSQTGGQSLQLFGPNVQSRHCVIAHMEGIVTVTPCSREAETYVNGQRIYETTLLQHGAVVRFGRHHTFRFLDPTVEERTRQPPLHHLRSSYTERMSSHEGSARGSMSRNFETTFDVDGNIETVSTASFRDDSRRSSRAWEGRSGGVRGHEAILPATLEFPEANEDAFLASLTTDLDVHNVHFKLAPTYTLYLAARYRASVHFRPDLTPPERAIKLTQVLSKAGRMVEGAIQAAGSNPPALSFWMANSSELLHFLKTDRHISAYSLDAQDILAECVQYGFRGLVTLLQGDVERCMPQVLDAHTEDSTLCMEGILGTLSHTMALLRTCRVNAALTIQLFSHLFHFVNMWLFNKLVIEGPLQLCSRFWGERLQQRLSHLEAWAEKQGLELAADCHLARITQAAHLLQAPKWTPEDIAGISAACFKLNSLQLCSLLERYQPAGDEPKIPQDLINNVVRVAESTADEILRSDGRPIKLEEDENLFLPFMLPEDGYSCDIVRGIPSGLTEFLAPLQHAGLCRFTPQPNSSGFWTIYMGSGEPVHARSPSAMSVRMSSAGDQVSPSGPQVVTIQLCKSNSGMGLSIVAAKGVGQDRLGIYIKSVVGGGAADQDGRLQAGDQLLKVDGASLQGITQERAAEIMMKTGQVVTLEVAKQGAIFHGLATLLSQPSPTITRAAYNGRYQSERDLPSRVPGLMPPRISSSKSVPSLNTGEPGSPSKVHEAYNPHANYTKPQNPPSHFRSRSTQNLASVAGVANGGVIRGTSNPNLPPNQQYGSGPMPSSYPHHPPHMNGYSPAQNFPDQRASSQQRSFRGSEGVLNRSHRDGDSRPQSALMSPHPQYQSGEVHRPVSHRDLRQEAKMHDIGEEVLRREERVLAFRAANANSSQGMTGVYPGPGYSRGGTQNEDIPPARPPLPPESAMFPSVRPSSAYPAQISDNRSPSVPTSQQLNQQMNKIFSASNPWDREEREREAARRAEVARLWRDQQIAMLEGESNRTPKQEEQLRTLRLEKEFQRRAEEAAKGDDEDNDDDDDEVDRRGLLRIVQEDLERSRQRRIAMEANENKRLQTMPANASPHWRNSSLPQVIGGGHPQQQQQHMTGGTSRSKAEEIRMKEQQLHAAQLAEERILRVAQKRQEEDMRRSAQVRSAPLRNGPILQMDQPPPLPKSPPPNLNTPPVQPSHHRQENLNTPVQTAHRRLENLIQEPEAQRIIFDANANQEKPPRTHPEVFLSEAETMLSSTQSPPNSSSTSGSTPGVIGAQEIYRDPRQKRLAEQQQRQQGSKGPNAPEKLTFREKMRMFALETGEAGTPRDRVKISKAQREIEGPPTSTTPS